MWFLLYIFDEVSLIWNRKIQSEKNNLIGIFYIKSNADDDWTID